MQEKRKFTKTEETKKMFTKRAKLLLKRHDEEAGVSWKKDPLSVISWVESKKAEWSFETNKQYIYCLIYFMENNGPIEVIEALKKIEFNKTSNNSGKTSSTKLKQLPEKDYISIVKEINKRWSEYGEITILWLKAGILTGIRPNEWKNAYIENKNTLVVKNAKNTNDRTAGTYRKLILSEMSKSDKEAITRFLKLYKEKMLTKDPEAIYEGCKRFLTRVNRKIWPSRKKYVTLYSARHQFSANMKASGFSKGEIALAMGHVSEKTAQMHYGKARYGYPGGMGIKIDKTDIDKVRSTEEFILPKLKKNIGGS